MSRYHLQYRRYRLPFRVPVRTAHGNWTEREGVLVRLAEAGAGPARALGAGFGEAAPIPWFGTETADEIEAAVRGLGEWVTDEALAALPEKLGCLRRAISSARAMIAEHDAPAATQTGTGEHRYLPLAALLPAGRAALAQLPPKAEIGFRIFKWKVGVGDIADELSLLDDLCAVLPAGAKLRLDANGAWDRRKAERWLERCADRPIEFLEQPCGADASQGEAARRRVDDVLLGLAGDYPTPIALDESIAGNADIERWLGLGWPGVFVVKPALLGSLDHAVAQLVRAKSAVVFSSALETAVGARSGLRAALDWPGERRAAGFGVWPLFADGRFDGPGAAPFIREQDVRAINVEAVWNALS